MPARLPFPEFPLAIGHKPARKIYYVVWGGVEGVRKAKAAGKNAVDIDIALSRDRVVVPVHGPTLYSRTRYWGGFKRIPGVGGLTGRVSSIDAVDLYRLEHKTGHKIDTLREVLTECVRLDMVACLEAKGGGWDEEAWRQVYDLAQETGAWVVAMTLGSKSKAGNRAALARLRPAEKVGLPTMLLARGYIGAEWIPVLSAVKSSTRQTAALLPDSIKRVRHLVTAPPAPRRSAPTPEPQPEPEEAAVPKTFERNQWNARTARGRVALNPAEVEGIAFHWPGTDRPISGVLAVQRALRGWQDYHMDGRKWSDIAYQRAIDQDGNVYVLRGLKTRSGANGDLDLNRRYGAVLLVLAPGERPSAEMTAAAQETVREHRSYFPKSKKVVGHGQIRRGGTDCPGPAVLSAISKGLFEPARSTDPQPKPALPGPRARAASLIRLAAKVVRRPEVKRLMLSAANAIERGEVK